MSLDLTRIPDLDGDQSAGEPSQALRDLKPTGRRTVLRGIALSGVAVGAAVLGWSPLSGMRSASAETGPNGLRGWDRNDCKDAYPVRSGYPSGGYNEERDTGGAYTGSAAACYGGDFMGSDYCSSGWHRSGTVRDAPITRTYVPISSACGSGATKNAWKWTAGGRTWRCSDGHTTVSGGGSSRTYLTICRAPV